MAYLRPPFKFIGFSSFTKGNELTDFQLVLRDLQNTIDTMWGECDWNIEYGNRTIEFIHELQTNNMASLLENELNRIINYDPRLQPVRVDIVERNSLYYANCVVNYLGKNYEVTLTFGTSQDV